ncbi:hypothetical protein [Rhodoferax sp. BLA1]|uniref:hypothetical protein n=1 Tax=Rhodoferax sp. BLA1 TaxID=2576062 RepID=UPI0015D45424|nr:hypothetical protein [Rhodoferax sp. BLA1]
MSKLVGYLAVGTMTAVNAIVFGFFSLFAVRGDGGPQFISTVWIFGFIWVAFFAAWGFSLVVRGEPQKGLNATARALPIIFGLALAWGVIASFVGK